LVACSRLRDSGEKGEEKTRAKKRAGAGVPLVFAPTLLSESLEQATALEAVIIVLAFLNLFVPIPCATVLLLQLQISRLCHFQYCFLHFSFSKSHN